MMYEVDIRTPVHNILYVCDWCIKNTDGWTLLFDENDTLKNSYFQKGELMKIESDKWEEKRWYFRGLSRDDSQIIRLMFVDITDAMACKLRWV